MFDISFHTFWHFGTFLRVLTMNMDETFQRMGNNSLFFFFQGTVVRLFSTPGIKYICISLKAVAF